MPKKHINIRKKYERPKIKCTIFVHEFICLYLEKGREEVAVISLRFVKKVVLEGLKNT